MSASKFTLSDIKNEIKQSGTNKGKFLTFKEGTKVRVHFLTDLEDGIMVPFHSNWDLRITVPCQETFGRDCEYCDRDDMRTRNNYIWSVYVYDSNEVKLLMAAVNNCSPVPFLSEIYETFGTITDRDIVIKQIGSGTNKTFSVVAQEKMKFRNKQVKPLSESAILKIIDKAYPNDNADDEDERPLRNKTKTKKKQPPMNEPEDEEDDEGEMEQPDYSSMTARALYNLCKERGIECRTRLDKDDYIELLEEDDDSDNWGDEEEDDEDDGLPWM